MSVWQSVGQPFSPSVRQSVTSEQYRRHKQHTCTHFQTQTLAISVAFLLLAFLRASKNKATLKMLMPSARPNDRPIDTDIDRCPQTSKTNARLPSHRYTHVQAYTQIRERSATHTCKHVPKMTATYCAPRVHFIREFEPI